MSTGMVGFICGIFAGAFLGFFVCGLLVTLNDDRRKK